MAGILLHLKKRLLPVIFELLEPRRISGKYCVLLLSVTGDDMLVYVGEPSDPVCDSYSFCDMGICLNLGNISYFKSSEMFSVICFVLTCEGVVILCVLLVVLWIQSCFGLFNSLCNR